MREESCCFYAFLFLQKCHINLSIKHSRCRAGHVYEIFLAVPQDLQVTAEQFYGNRLVLIYQSIQSGSNSDCTCSRAAGKCLTGTTFPDTHLECMAIDDLYKFGIDTIREINVIFEFRNRAFRYQGFSGHPCIRLHVGFP